MTLNMSEVKKLNDLDIKETIINKEKDLVKLRFKLAGNLLKDITEVSRTRKEIARLKTELKIRN